MQRTTPHLAEPICGLPANMDPLVKSFLYEVKARAEGLSPQLAKNVFTQALFDLVECGESLTEPANDMESRQDESKAYAYAFMQISMAIVALQQKEADINHRDANGYTPLMLAVIDHRNPIVKAFANNPQTDLWARNNAGRTAYDMATKYKTREILENAARARAGKAPRTHGRPPVHVQVSRQMHAEMWKRSTPKSRRR